MRIALGAALSVLAVSAQARDIIVSSASARLAPAELWARLETADIVFVGEQHDQAPHHAVQLEVIRELHRRRPSLVVGLEMIDILHQHRLDDWVAGRMSEAELEAFWRSQWSWFPLYKPILDEARRRKIKLLALNAPRAVISQIARGGLDSLAPEQRAQLPAEIFPIEEPRYLEYVRRSAREHRPAMTPEEEARMVAAMAAWNCRMAETALEPVRAGRPLVVLVGAGHLFYRAGILESVARRGGAAQAVLLPYPLDGAKRPLQELLDELARPDKAELGDYFWLLPDT